MANHRLKDTLERFPSGLVEVHNWFPNQLLSITRKVYVMSSAALQVFPRPRDSQLHSSLCRLLKGHLLLTEADKSAGGHKAPDSTHRITRFQAPTKASYYLAYLQLRGLPLVTCSDS